MTSEVLLSTLVGFWPLTDATLRQGLEVQKRKKRIRQRQERDGGETFRHLGASSVSDLKYKCGDWTVIGKGLGDRSVGEDRRC